jgi:hypothetical protein
MATDKKHIAVYLDPAIEQALIAFCERKGLKSKKGTMFSAGVNAALSEFFGISDIEESNTPQKVDNIPHTGNIPQETGNILPSSSNIPASADNTILPDTSNIPSENLVVEVHELRSQLKAEYTDREEIEAELAQFKKYSEATITAQKEKIRDLERGYGLTPTHTENILRRQLADLQAELSGLKQKILTSSVELPEAADLLNQLKARRKKSKADLVDLETILEILEDGGEKTLQQALDKIAGKHDR